MNIQPTTSLNLPSPFLFIVRYILFAVALMAVSKAIAAGPIENQTLIYSVDYAGQNAGELEVIINTEGDQLSVTSHSHLSLLAKMFLTAQTSKANFSLAQGHPRLISGADYQQKDQSLLRSFTISDTTITLSNNDQIPFAPGELLDADAFPIALMASELSTLPGRKVFTVSGKRVRVDTYQSIANETITTPSGDIPTSRVTRMRDDAHDNAVTYWLNKHQIPVRILSTKKGKKTTLTLLSRHP